MLSTTERSDRFVWSHTPGNAGRFLFTYALNKAFFTIGLLFVIFGYVMRFVTTSILNVFTKFLCHRAGQIRLQ